MKKKALLLMLFLMLISTNALSQNWIQGQITGAIQEGIKVLLYQIRCGGDVWVLPTTSNSEGYYGFGNLDNGSYGVVPLLSGHEFTPEVINIEIPQAELQSYDFTATKLICDDVDRFLDNGDGTVTDCRTDIVWLQNANCFGSRNWGTAISWTAEINSGDCGLTDGSAEGDWHLPTKEELQGIGTDPPTTWNDEFPSAIWTRPSTPFIDVRSWYWSSTEYATPFVWVMSMAAGNTAPEIQNERCFVWPVRSAD